MIGSIMWPSTLSYPPKRLKLVKFLQNGKVSQIYTSFSEQCNELYVVKRFKKQYMTKRDTDLVRNEIDINHKLTNHPNILKMFGHWETKKKMYLLFEHANQGDLFAYIQNHQSIDIDIDIDNEHKTKKYQMITGIISALSYMHEKGIIHYDLKPENIFLKNGRVLVADFGLSIDTSNKRRYINRCTLEYTAPEQLDLNKLPENLEAIDSWCMGILLFEISHGLTPFSGFSREEVRDSVTEPISCKNKDFESAIMNLTQQAPERRMTSVELSDFFSLGL